MKTMTQVKNEYAERVLKAYKKALANATDEVEVDIVLYYKGIAETPKKTTLKDLRFAVDIVETLAERK